MTPLFLLSYKPPICLNHHTDMHLPRPNPQPATNNDPRLKPQKIHSH